MKQQLRRLLSAVVACAAFTAWSVHAAPPSAESQAPSKASLPSMFDTFVAQPTRRPLVDAAALTPESRALLQDSKVSSTEPRLGVPTFIWAPRDRVAAAHSLRAQGVPPEVAAKRYAVKYAELYRASPTRWGEARVTLVHDLHDEGAVIVTLQQQVQGRKVFRDELHVIMTPSLELVALSGYLTPEVRTLSAFNLDADAAARAAFTDLTGSAIAEGTVRELAPRDEYRRFELPNTLRPARVQPMWYAMPNGLEASFYVEVEAARGEHSSAFFSFIISAADGRTLARKNLTASDSFSYRVWADPIDQRPFDGPHGTVGTPHPTGTPNNYIPPFLAPNLLTLQNGPISTNDQWLAPGATTTAGNNAKAYLDVSPNDGFGTGDVMADVTAPGVFDRVYDTSLMPNASTEQQKATVAQLFYNVNFFHDWYYDRGFDEKAGNGQLSNYGRGGRQSDELLAEGQDYNGEDNADMSTPSDGDHPRMQMYVFRGAETKAIKITGGLSYTVNTATFGPQRFSISGDVVAVNDGDTSNGSTATDGCTTPFTTSVTGKIALIDRGLCTFVEKVEHAQSQGAIGVIIVDNSTQGSGNRAPDLVGQSSTVTIPSLSLSRNNGADFKMKVAAGPVNVSMERSGDIDRDGALDNAIVAHEWGHYISNRLIGDGNGLFTNQSVGMGEGWSDFHSMLMVVRKEDLQIPSNAGWAGVYGLAAYTSAATSSNAYYFGIRRLPYSTDMMKNGLTLKHVQDGVVLPTGVPTAFGANGSFNSEVHATGEVWATMLWECYAALLNDPRYTFEQAQDRMLRYLVAAYKATALMPTFVEARDAVLAVASAKDEQDFTLFWKAFAKRGMGLLAVAPDRGSFDNTPVTESFDVGNAIQISKVSIDDSVQSCDHDGLLDRDEVGRLNVTVRNVGVGRTSQTTIAVTTSMSGVSFPGGANATVPALAPFEAATVPITVQLAGVRGAMGGQFSIALSEPTLVGAKTITLPFNTRLNFNVIPTGATLDDVESPVSTWTVANNPNGDTGSDFRIFAETPTQHVWFGPNAKSPADTYLRSPALEVGAGSFVISFKHRYDFEADTQAFYDGAVIELSLTGTSGWQDIGQKAMPGYGGAISSRGSNPLGGRDAYVSQSTNYPAFVQETIDLGTTYANKRVYIRFRVGSDDAAAAKGWELDDIAFSGITNKPFGSVIADPNQCGGNRAPIVSVSDLLVAENTNVTLPLSVSDPDGDPLTITWTQKEGPEVMLVNNASFVAPKVPVDTRIVFEVSVTDGAIASAPARVVITVMNIATPPVATVPAVVQVKEGETITIPGTATDVDNTLLLFAWSQVAGPAGTLTNDATDTVTFTAPSVTANVTAVVQLVVTNGTLWSAPVRTEIMIENDPTNDPKVEPKKAAACGCSFSPATTLLGVALALLARRKKSRE